MINAKIYTSISDMPLYNFIKCLLSSDLSYMKKEKGLIKPSKLRKAWENIFAQYLEKSGNESNQVLLHSLKRYQVLVNKIKLIDSNIEMLSITYSNDIAYMMKKLGYPVNEIKDREKYMQQLVDISKRAKTLVFQANKIKKDLDNFNENASSESVTEDDFNEILIILSKNQGYRLDAKEITVLEFVLLLKVNTEKNKTDGERAKN